MTYPSGVTTSDSVNLGSNPSSPATRNADVSGVSRTPGAAEIPAQAEQTAHTGRTETGTAPDRAWTQDEIDEQMFDDEDDDQSAECGRWNGGHLTRQCRLAGSEWCDWDCPIGIGHPAYPKV